MVDGSIRRSKLSKTDARKVAVKSSRFNYKFNYGVGGASAKTWKRVRGFVCFFRGVCALLLTLTVGLIYCFKGIFRARSTIV